MTMNVGPEPRPPLPESPPHPPRLPPPVPFESGTAPLTPVSRHGSIGTPRRRASMPGRGIVYTLCLVVLILAALAILGIANAPRIVQVLALVIGSGSAGILLGRGLSIEGLGIGVGGIEDQRVQRIPAQQFPHEHDQRGQK